MKRCSPSCSRHERKGEGSSAWVSNHYYMFVHSWFLYTEILHVSSSLLQPTQMHLPSYVNTDTYVSSCSGLRWSYWVMGQYRCFSFEGSFSSLDSNRSPWLWWSGPSNHWKEAQEKRAADVGGGFVTALTAVRDGGLSEQEMTWPPRGSPAHPDNNPLSCERPGSRRPQPRKSARPGGGNLKFTFFSNNDLRISTVRRKSLKFQMCCLLFFFLLVLTLMKLRIYWRS